ncbi:MAG TPA: hypothetical protein DHV63_12005 [Pseudomonas sp.]|nr:hypothetical protein [Pseudomonas sp.]
MLKLTIVGFCLCCAAELAAEPLKIVDYPLESVALYDAEGAFQGDLPRDQLPKPEVEVVAFDEKRNLLAIELGDRQVWLDPLDVKLNKGKTVTFDCRKVAETSMPMDRKAGVTMGYSQNCGK